MSGRAPSGSLWASKVDYNTWFGSNAEYIYGIQMLPITPALEELLPAHWMRRVLQDRDFSDAMHGHSGASDGWRGLLLGASGVVDARAAWELAQGLRAYDSGNSRTNLLYWLATRGEQSQSHRVLLTGSPSSPSEIGLDIGIDIHMDAPLAYACAFVAQQISTPECAPCMPPDWQ